MTRNLSFRVAPRPRPAVFLLHDKRGWRDPPEPVRPMPRWVAWLVAAAILAALVWFVLGVKAFF